MALEATPAVSARLAAAQEQLQELRRKRRQERLQERLPVRTDAHGRLISPLPSAEPAPSTYKNSPHLGWESESLTANLRSTRERAKLTAGDHSVSLEWLNKEDFSSPPERSSPGSNPQPARCSATDSLRLYPDLALAMLRQNLVAPGRVWLLLRHLDHQGRGWVRMRHVRAQLTTKGSPLHLCGWRQLRNLLSQGEGIFWQRDGRPLSEARIWLRSTARVAAALKVSRLATHAVALQVAVLLKSIGTVRAHFYASYHSGRSKSNPISRQRLAEITSISRRSQHNYEKITGVQQRPNWAIGSKYSKQAAQERAWKQGRAVFQLHDYKGKAGAPGASYVAWQLPNNYTGPHEQYTTANRKRVNRQLVDLFMKGITGNGKRTVADGDASSEEDAVTPCFYEHGEAAARAYNRSPQDDIYWQSHKRFRQYRVWHVLAAQEKSE